LQLPLGLLSCWLIVGAASDSLVEKIIGKSLKTFTDEARCIESDGKLWNFIEMHAFH